MLLEGRNAVVYGGGGAIGGAVARAFAREGARVFLAGRTRERLEEGAHRGRAGRDRVLGTGTACTWTSGRSTARTGRKWSAPDR
ncbi:MAG TPA: SDR family NAD(P)-dependent oxidoreductase, partial [Actinomycetota bacterium]|nr:SDR family NAD(P)-dependent oxidoreductase [Actinomycetota bacterium]